MEHKEQVNGKETGSGKASAELPPEAVGAAKAASETVPEVEATEKLEIKRMRAFEAMTNTEGWKHYQALLNYEINTRAAAAFEPVELGAVLASEHKKGTIYGLIKARDIVAVSIAAVKQELEARKKNP